MEGRSLRAHRSESVKGTEVWNARPWRAVDLATATVGRSTRWLERFLLQRPDPISKQEQQTSSKPAESFQLELYRRFHG